MPTRAKPKARTVSSEDESESCTPVLEAQRRIQQLRKRRDERLKAVVADTHAALKDLQSRIQEHYEQKRQQIMGAQAKHITILVKNMERRKEIEAEMMELIVSMHTQMKEVEEMILAGYDGRLEEMREVLNEAQEKLC